MLGGVVLQPLGPLLGPEMQLEGIKKRNQKRDPKIIKKTVLKWDPKMLQKSMLTCGFNKHFMRRTGGAIGMNKVIELQQIMTTIWILHDSTLTIPIKAFN